jgi:dystroglycan 1
LYSFFFYFQVKPTVVLSPQRQIQINVGQTLTIQCTARGSPAPYINWRLNWGHICGDGSDNGRCAMLQSIDQNDPSLVSGTLTIRNVNLADAGAYSCEALNNQGFVFAVPDAIVDVNGLYFVKKSRIFYIELIFLNNSRGSNITTM